jgi:hypothetical protein
MIPGRRRDASADGAVLLRTRHDFYRQAKVLAVSWSDEHNRIAQAKSLGDVTSDTRRRGCRECERHRVAQPLAGGAKPQIGRSEVVPPLRDAMSLVHAEERGSSALETGPSGARFKRLRRGEDDEATAAFKLLERGPALGRTQSAVEHDDRYAAAPERALLVGHEGNEWRDDDRRLLEDHRWHLIDQRLSKTGRKRHERVVVPRGWLPSPIPVRAGAARYRTSGAPSAGTYRAGS